jgi:polysaccharide export outer membrane protein
MVLDNVHLGRGRFSGLPAVLLATFLLAGCQTSEKTPFAELPGDDGTSGADVTAAKSPGDSTASATNPASSGSSPIAVGKQNKSSDEKAPGSESSLNVIGSGETLVITFSDTPNLLQPFQEKVRDDGSIILLYNQVFHVAGKTIGEAAREIRARYVPDYFQQLTVSVTSTERLQRFFYVDGEVKAPSRQLYSGPITVTQGITSCGGFTDFAKKTKVKLIRANGKVEIINCKKAINDPRLDLEVRPFDKIYVPRSLL